MPTKEEIIQLYCDVIANTSGGLTILFYGGEHRATRQTIDELYDVLYNNVFIMVSRIELVNSSCHVMKY